MGMGEHCYKATGERAEELEAATKQLVEFLQQRNDEDSWDDETICNALIESTAFFVANSAPDFASMMSAQRLIMQKTLHLFLNRERGPCDCENCKGKAGDEG